MPCNGVAVASAQIEQELEKFLGLLGQETIDQAVVVFLASQGLTATGSDGRYTVSPRQGAGKALMSNLGVVQRTGNEYYSVFIRGGRVNVEGSNGIKASEIAQKLEGLLSALAGKSRQNVLVQTLQKAGITIKQSQVASNAAVVLTVEL